MKRDEDKIQDEAGHLWGKILARWKANPSANNCDFFLVFLCHSLTQHRAKHQAAAHSLSQGKESVKR